MLLQVIKKFEVLTKVHHHFATTKMTVTVQNTGQHSEPVGFHMTLRKEELITNVSVIRDGETLIGEFQRRKESAESRKTSLDTTDSAVHLNLSPRYLHATVYQMAMRLRGNSEVTFEVESFRLLEDQSKEYNYEAYVNFQHDVKTFKTEAQITPCDRDSVVTKKLKQELLQQEGNIIDISNSRRMKKVVQKRCDVTWTNAGGRGGQKLRWAFTYKNLPILRPKVDCLISDGYFLNFFRFSEQNKRTVLKNIVFALDKSGSMYPYKIERLKTAMKNIFQDKSVHGTFNILSHANDVHILSKSPQHEFIQSHSNFVSQMAAGGMSDIDKALLYALDMLRNSTLPSQLGILYFVTDGIPTKGEQDMDKIVKRFNIKNTNKFPIFSIAYGDDIDLPFLKSLSHKNFGFVRKIEDTEDATIDIVKVFQDFSRISLRNVTIGYGAGNPTIQMKTKTDFPFILDGVEYVVAGKVKNMASITKSYIQGIHDSNQYKKTFKCSVADSRWKGLTKKIWAYLTLLEKLHDRAALGNHGEGDRESDQDIETFALAQKFVTPETTLKFKDVRIEFRQTDAEYMATPDLNFLKPFYPIHFSPSDNQGSGKQVGTPSATHEPSQEINNAVIEAIVFQWRFSQNQRTFCIAPSDWGNGLWALLDYRGIKIFLSQCIQSCPEGLNLGQYLKIKKYRREANIFLNATDTCCTAEDKRKIFQKNESQENIFKFSKGDKERYIVQIERSVNGSEVLFKVHLTLKFKVENIKRALWGMMRLVATPGKRKGLPLNPIQCSDVKAKPKHKVTMTRERANRYNKA